MKYGTVSLTPNVNTKNQKLTRKTTRSTGGEFSCLDCARYYLMLRVLLQDYLFIQIPCGEINPLISACIGLWVKSYIDLHKTYCFKFEVLDLSSLIILDKLMLVGKATPFIMSIIILESYAILMSQISNLDVSFRTLHKMCPAILFVVWSHAHAWANFSLVFSHGSLEHPPHAVPGFHFSLPLRKNILPYTWESGLNWGKNLRWGVWKLSPLFKTPTFHPLQLTVCIIDCLILIFCSRP